MLEKILHNILGVGITSIIMKYSFITTPKHKCFETGYYEKCKEIIEQIMIFDIKSKNKYYLLQTLLIISSENGYLDITNMIINKLIPHFKEYEIHFLRCLAFQKYCYSGNLHAVKMYRKIVNEGQLHNALAHAYAGNQQHIIDFLNIKLDGVDGTRILLIIFKYRNAEAFYKFIKIKNNFINWSQLVNISSRVNKQIMLHCMEHTLLVDPDVLFMNSIKRNNFTTIKYLAEKLLLGPKTWDMALLESISNGVESKIIEYIEKKSSGLENVLNNAYEVILFDMCKGDNALIAINEFKKRNKYEEFKDKIINSLCNSKNIELLEYCLQSG